METDFPGGSAVQNLPATAGSPGSIPGEGNAACSEILLWEIPWREEAWQATVYGVAKSRTKHHQQPK